MSREEIINNLIKKEQVNTNLISDGYHTFGELYEHRIELFITLARLIQTRTMMVVWRFKTDDKWFLLGIHKTTGEQITYHLPVSKWEECDFADTPTIKPEWDGHTSADVLKRLKELI